MKPDSTLAQLAPLRTPVSRQWFALLVAALLHLLVLNWAGERIGIPSAAQRNQTVITADLRPPEAAPAPAILPKPKLRAKAPAKARTRPPAPAAAGSIPVPAVAETRAETPGAGIEPAAAPITESTAEPAPAEAAGAPVTETAGIHYKVDPPPSVELKYDVQQTRREGQTVYGRGKIRWQTQDGKYSVSGEAGAFFFTLLNFASEGAIDDFGVAPVRYSEKRFRKSETNTHFNRDERNSISFSASQASYPRSGGEQDRASIIWQLAGIGRGDSEKFVPGAEIDLFVAGVRDAETWRLRVLGLEEIEVGSGKTAAWHIVRAPRADSYDQQLDIWLAPQQQWYPVKLRYTESNGDYLDMSLSSLDMPGPGSASRAAPR